MARRPFLDRFSSSGASRDALAPVLRNLEAVLNTREGYGFFQQGFGLGDYTGNRGGKELVPFLTETLQRQVTQYEPRLREVEVTLRGQDGALCLHFEVAARLGEQALRLALVFDTVSSRVRLERKD
ncbi:type VI secretion system baseplate subunit TssE [Pyxidicoccus fallax]|uniref:Type VI secretion system baseplate subunit TssE n=1 Tax=Pyxidicoccus fallax TaxID=394095 RepID=A0A848LM09_9BACT|nr:GPW/gp25 family protein [Pyxidicoccus fallax]NMO18634.1 type VI secretion system baseplate subunit TssE [Pyxidicoccus fallax]NPC79039.1 type VI secretion system baseplate subunit TssE [Pyxidicoccus fallax]